MSAIFDALDNLPKRQPKKHFVMIDGNKIEVTLEKKLEIMRHGEDKYMVKDSKVVIKPIHKIKSKFRKLIKSEKGYYFVDNDIHWPEKVDAGGKTWQIEYE